MPISMPSHTRTLSSVSSLGGHSEDLFHSITGFDDLANDEDLSFDLDDDVKDGAMQMMGAGNNDDDDMGLNGEKGTGPQKKGKRQQASTAEKKATHNAVERARRESLNGRFLVLADMLPGMNSIKRASKAAIVNKSIALIQDLQVSEKKLSKENKALKAELEALKKRWGLVANNGSTPPATAENVADPSNATPTTRQTQQQSQQPQLPQRQPSVPQPSAPSMFNNAHAQAQAQAQAQAHAHAHAAWAAMAAASMVLPPPQHPLQQTPGHPFMMPPNYPPSLMQMTSNQQDMPSQLAPSALNVPMFAGYPSFSHNPTVASPTSLPGAEYHQQQQHNSNSGNSPSASSTSSDQAAASSQQQIAKQMFSQHPMFDSAVHQALQQQQQRHTQSPASSAPVTANASHGTESQANSNNNTSSSSGGSVHNSNGSQTSSPASSQSVLTPLNTYSPVPLPCPAPPQTNNGGNSYDSNSHHTASPASAVSSGSPMLSNSTGNINGAEATAANPALVAFDASNDAAFLASQFSAKDLQKAQNDLQAFIAYQNQRVMSMGGTSNGGRTGSMSSTSGGEASSANSLIPPMGLFASAAAAASGAAGDSSHILSNGFSFPGMPAPALAASSQMDQFNQMPSWQQQMMLAQQQFQSQQSNLGLSVNPFVATAGMGGQF